MNIQTFEDQLLTVGISFEGVSEMDKQSLLLKIENNVKDKIEIELHEQLDSETYKNLDSYILQPDLLKEKVPNLEELVKNAAQETVEELRSSISNNS